MAIKKWGVVVYWTFIQFSTCSSLNVHAADIGYFWHITDFHYDHTYNDSRLSCNKENTPETIGQYGTSWCDSPWALVNSSVRAMTEIQSNVDFLIWTGDRPLHAPDEELTYSVKRDILTVTTNALKEAFPGTSMYPIYGNHDYFPDNQFPANNNMFYNDTYEEWKGWIGDDTQKNNFLKGGYYTTKTAHGLRIIAMNTNLYYIQNYAVINETDPADQFKWLEDTLNDASMAGEKVLILSHISVGFFTPYKSMGMYERFNRRMVEILQKHAVIITGVHCGHDHNDSFKLLLDDNGEGGCPIFISPSVTPWKYKPQYPDHNPAIRLVTYDRRTGEHLEISQYYLDLEEANSNGVAEWKLEYNMTDSYKLPDLTTPSLLELIQRLGDRKGEEFQNYLRYFVVDPQNVPYCDEDCHSNVLCGFTNFESDDFDACKRGLMSSSNSIAPSLSLFLAIYFMIYTFGIK